MRQSSLTSTFGIWVHGGSIQEPGGYTPDDVADVVSHQQRAPLIQRHADRPTEGVAIATYEPGQYNHGQPGGLSVLEGNKDDFVAATRPAIPRAVLADEHAGRERGREGRTGRPSQAQRGSMRTQCVVRSDGRGYQVRAPRRHPFVDMLAIVTVGPTIEGAVAHRSQIVGHQIAPEFIALVHHGPEHAARRLPGKPIRVSQPGGEYAVRARLRIHLPNGGSLRLDHHA